MKITRPGTSVVIREDNRGCIGMATNLETKRSKHIDVRHHFIRDNVASGRIKIEPIETENQVADIFTKALDFNRFRTLRRTLGLSD
ncbi:hypothetical protein RP20_CCG006034 [Aedes albopictus]|nr:hypothetical protein RP20_CCG006034 [Aedes albopictus]